MNQSPIITPVTRRSFITTAGVATVGALAATLVGIARGGLDAHIGADAGQHHGADAAAAQLQVRETEQENIYSRRPPKLEFEEPEGAAAQLIFASTFSPPPSRVT